MKKILVPALLTVLVLTAAAKRSASDPVLMTVAGHDVPVSEFEYLYLKNNQQQAQPQTLDEYVDMFVNYKLKVADAEANGIDTTRQFRDEYTRYCNELAAPFLNDTSVVAQLRDEAYQRTKTERHLAHIMVQLGRTPQERYENRKLIDSLRSVLNENPNAFAQLALRYSTDRTTRTRGGDMGWARAGQFPYPFEYAAWSTPVGEISDVIDDAPYGYHIIRVSEERPMQQVYARHILKLTRDIPAEQAAVKKAEIDSIYALLLAGADFAQLAQTESEDPGSARAGGMLPWFGRGQMVPQFEQTAFALEDNAISEPIETPYGYHIVQTLAHRDSIPYDEAINSINTMMARDQRSAAPREARLAQFKSQYNASLDASTMNNIQRQIERAGSADSTTVAALRANTKTLGKVANRKFSVADAAIYLPDHLGPTSPQAFIDAFREAADHALDVAVTAYARENLANSDNDYRNLINEYRDGILLFDISNRNVWERSNNDREGLQAFFEANRDRYTWPAPKYKAIIVSAVNDSIAQAAESWLRENPCGVDSIVAKLRAQFGRNVKVERKVMAKGEDPVMDFLAFDGPKPSDTGRWKAFFIYEGKLLTAPEEAGDVRSLVVNDYQDYLMNRWIEELHNKYSVKVNRNVLEQLRSRLENNAN